MKERYEIVIKTGGLSEEEIAKLRQKARKKALIIRNFDPEVPIFLVEEDNESEEKREIQDK
ncbi:potential G-patch domain protein [Thermodesulfatator indicus DSM 15286]|uniref:Potential G-patch domain protein n=1 Tax=Thermodesulfatator indicus (strain DSM 15286 / JCM 11887 / CIR29812) TaxID=667014 RepID=F8ACN3_THEID|nr:G-patch domain-containing protein [Thermodesulfatator indicus]AEH45808.1 potential G-patch domain protein [Thermodesulfatator indicus DSM 15286]